MNDGYYYGYYIPKSLRKVTITDDQTIPDYAFMNCDLLEVIVLPDDVTGIGWGAFFGCTALTSITFKGTSDQWKAIDLGSDWHVTNWYADIPATVINCADGVACIRHTEVIDISVAPSCTATGLTAGKHCSVCDEVLVAQQEVPATGHSNNSEITPPTATANGCILYTCTVCGETEEETIAPKQYTFTGEDVPQFHDGDSILRIPAVFQGEEGTWYRVTDISTSLYDETNLVISKMYIPSSVLVIPMPIYDLGRRANEVFRIIVDEDHPNYSVRDTVLYNKNQTELVFCPGNMSACEIPDSVMTIGEYAFGNCTYLPSITIPDSVTSIGNSAFFGCTGLSSITFNGTKSEWNSISKGANWQLGIPATEVICSDGTVPLN